MITILNDPLYLSDEPANNLSAPADNSSAPADNSSAPADNTSAVVDQTISVQGTTTQPTVSANIHISTVRRLSGAFVGAAAAYMGDAAGGVVGTLSGMTVANIVNEFGSEVDEMLGSAIGGDTITITIQALDPRNPP